MSYGIQQFYLPAGRDDVPAMSSAERLSWPKQVLCKYIAQRYAVMMSVPLEPGRLKPSVYESAMWHTAQHFQPCHICLMYYTVSKKTVSN